MLVSLFTPLLSLALVATAVAGMPDTCEAEVSAAAPATAQNGKAIYIITNEKENQVLAIPIGAAGMLSKGTCIGTGGAGSNSLDDKNQPAVPDPLVSQSALTVAGNVRHPQRTNYPLHSLILSRISLRSMLAQTQ